MKVRHACIIRRKKSVSSPPSPNKGLKGSFIPWMISHLNSAFPVRDCCQFRIVPVGYSGRSQNFPRTIHSGGFDSNIGLTGPNTPSEWYSLHVLKSFNSQSGSGNSSSSMQAIYSPCAMASALFLARAIFCSGSMQYTISLGHVWNKSMIGFAEAKLSLSVTTIE